MTGGGRWVGIHSWQEETSQASKNAKILSVAHIGDNQGAFCSQEQPGLNLSDLTPPFLSHCVNVKVTISLADNYFHVYWQGSSSGLKDYCEPCVPGSQHPLTISLFPLRLIECVIFPQWVTLPNVELVILAPNTTNLSAGWCFSIVLVMESDYTFCCTAKPRWKSEDILFI